MKRNISITMGMALVGIVAIIATLGLFSLNQAAPVEAQAARTYGGGDVFGASDSPLFRFTAPEELGASTTIEFDLLNFAGKDSINAAADVEFAVAGETGYTITDVADGVITLTEAIDADAKVSIIVLSAAVLVPTEEGDHTASLDIDVGGTGQVDYSDVAPVVVTVQNEVEELTSVLLTDPEDRANDADEDVVNQIMVTFTTNNGAGGLSLVDSDTITITLENFQLPKTINADHVTIMSEGDDGKPDKVRVIGQEIELFVPDMDNTMGGRQPISENVPVTVTLTKDAGIMNPSSAGQHKVKVHTSQATADVEMGVVINATTPDIISLLLTPNIARAPTRIAVRFSTDVDIPSGETLTLTLNSFGLPDYIDPPDVTINGVASRLATPNLADNTVEITLEEEITVGDQSRRVAVIISRDAGITNPAVAGDYDVELVTTIETMADTASVVIEPVIPPEVVPFSAKVQPNDAGADTRMVVSFFVDAPLNESDQIIITLEDDWRTSVTSLNPDLIVIRANHITGHATQTGSSAARPQSAVLELVSDDDPKPDQPEITLVIDDMSTLEGTQGIAAGSQVDVIFNQGSGVKNPPEAGRYNVRITVITGGSVLVTEKLSNEVVIPAKLRLSSNTGKRGAELTLVAKGVEGNRSVTFWLDEDRDGVRDPNERDLNCTSVATRDDTATCTVVLTNPPFRYGRDGKNFINFQDGENRRVGSTDGTDKLTPIGDDSGYTNANYADVGDLIEEARFNLEPLVTPIPRTANTGDRVTFSLFDFPPGAIDFIEIANIRVAIPTPTPVVPESGELSFTFEIPSRGLNGERLPTGNLRLDVRNDGGGDGPGGGDGEDTFITIAGALISATATTVLANQDLTITGSGFTGTEAGRDEVCILRHIEDAAGNILQQGGITFNSVSLEIIDDFDCNLRDGNDVDGIELTSGGSFTLTVRLREEYGGIIPTALLTPGTHLLKVIDSRGTEGSTEVTIPERELTVTPATARPRDVVTISGRNYIADNPDGSNVEVAVVYDCATDADDFDADPDSSGHFTDTLRIPSDCAIPSTNTITAAINVGRIDTGIRDTITHDIPNAEVSVEPTLGAPGTTFTVTGLGFRTFEPLEEIRVGDRVVVREGAGYATDRDGNLVVSGVLVPGLDAGVHPVIVEVGAGEDRTTSSSVFEILEFGAPTAVPTGVMGAMEPLGESLVRIFNFNNATKSWTFYDPRPDFAEANTIDELFSGEIYWVNVSADTEAILNNKTRNLTCINGDCWNQIVW